MASSFVLVKDLRVGDVFDGGDGAETVTHIEPDKDGIRVRVSTNAPHTFHFYPEHEVELYDRVPEPEEPSHESGPDGTTERDPFGG